MSIEIVTTDIQNEEYDPQMEFYDCCRFGDEEVGISILQEFDVNPCLADEYGTTPIHAAAANGLVSLLSEIVKKPKINLNVQNEFGNTPLHFAALNRKNECVKILVAAGADTKVKNNNNQTPLFEACSNIINEKEQEVDAVDLLVGPDAEIPNTVEEDVNEILE